MSLHWYCIGKMFMWTEKGHEKVKGSWLPQSPINRLYRVLLSFYDLST